MRKRVTKAMMGQIWGIEKRKGLERIGKEESGCLTLWYRQLWDTEQRCENGKKGSGEGAREISNMDFGSRKENAGIHIEEGNAKEMQRKCKSDKKQSR